MNRDQSSGHRCWRTSPQKESVGILRPARTSSNEVTHIVAIEGGSEMTGTAEWPGSKVRVDLAGLFERGSRRHRGNRSMKGSCAVGGVYSIAGRSLIWSTVGNGLSGFKERPRRGDREEGFSRGTTPRDGGAMGRFSSRSGSTEPSIQK